MGDIDYTLSRNSPRLRQVKRLRMYNKILIIKHLTLLAAFLLTLMTMPAQAFVMLQGDTESVAVAPEILYFEDQTGSQSFFQAQSQFKRFEREAAPHDSTLIHLNREGSVYWLKMPVVNGTDQPNWVLHFESFQNINTKPVWLDEITIFTNDSVGKPLYTTRNNYIPLALSSQRQNDFLIMVKTIPGLETSFKPVLQTEQRFAADQRAESSQMTVSWIIISIFATASLIFFALSRVNAFLLFAVYSLVFIQGSIMSVDMGKKLYGLLSNVMAPVQILPFMATLISLAAVMLTASSIKDKALPAVLKLLAAVLVAMLVCSLFAKGVLLSIPVSVQVISKIVLLVTGSILAIIALSQSFQDTRNLWLLPAWLIFALQAFMIVANPLVLPFVHLALLGIAMIIQIYVLWQAQEKVRQEQQQKLQIEMNTVRQQHEKENFMWERKLESERGLLNTAKQREALRSTQLAEAKAQAEAANKAKSDFLAMITHEIRTPMTGIMGMVHLTAQTSLDDKQREYIDTIQNAGETLLILLNDVLDYSKLEKGAIVVETIPFNLRMVVQSVVTLMSGRANEKSLRIITHIADDVPDHLEGDPNRMRQVLINLLSNAIKFTERGSVTVDITREDSKPEGETDHGIALKFKIIDTGIGISKEGQEKLFGAYNQADASIARRFGGTGLGLNICRMLIQAMGGEIHVQSTPGQGSTFWFNLVLAESSAESAAFMAHQDVELIDIPPLTVLVVDDNPVNLKVVAGLLELDGHKVRTAESGTQAMQMVENGTFDLIFMDIQMPGFDGLTITKAIRKMSDRDKATVPIYALTGMGRDEDEQACQAAGMNGILMKPIRVPAFKRILVAVSQTKHKHAPAATAKPHEDPMKLKDIADKAKEVVADAKRTYEDVKSQVRIGLASDQISPHETGIAPPVATQTLSDSDRSALLSLATLEDLHKSLPAESFAEILAELEGKSDELVTGIELGWKARDKDDVAEKAHNLRGMAGNFGLNLLSLISERIERAVKTGQDDVVSAEVGRLTATLTHTKAALKDWKDSQ